MKPALEDVFIGPMASPHSARPLCFFNEQVDAIYVDDELLPTPKTIWSGWRLTPTLHTTPTPLPLLALP